MAHKGRHTLAAVALCALLPSLVTAQQPATDLDSMLRQQAVQTCANIRQGLFSVINRGGSESEVESPTGQQYQISSNVQRSIISEFPSGFDNPDMQNIMARVIRQYERTGRTEDLRRAAMNDELYMIPCTEVHLRKFKAMTQRFMEPLTLGNSQVTQPATATGNQRAMQPQTQYSEPSYNATPAPADQRSNPPRQRQLPQQDYGTGRR